MTRKRQILKFDQEKNVADKVDVGGKKHPRGLTAVLRLTALYVERLVTYLIVAKLNTRETMEP